MKYFAISIKTQFDNLGDALINRQLILEATKHGIVLVDLSRCPESFISMLDVDSKKDIKIFKSSANFVLEMIKLKSRGNTVFYFLNPGGLGRPNSIKKKFLATLHNAFLIFLMFFSIKIVHAGFSLSKQTSSDMFISSLRSKLCYKVTPRDSASYTYMKENGFNVDHVVPDFAFLLPLNNLPSNKSNTIIFSFRGDSEYNESKCFVKSIIISVFNANPSFIFRFVSQVKRDDTYTNELYDWFRKDVSSDCTIHFVSNDISENINLFSTSYAVFSNRLHVLMLCWSVGCTPYPCLAKGTGGKIKAIFTDLNLDNYVITKAEDVYSSPLEFGSQLVISFTKESERVKDYFSKELV